ncbi:MAG: alpha/beta hydrolase [Thermomicrobiales bacterium]
MNQIIRGGWRRWYLDCGSSEEVVVLLHGIPTNHQLWSGVADELTGDVRVIAPDLTGFGMSDLPSSADLSPGGQATDIFGFLDDLGVGRFHLVVHDYGFLVGCEMISAAPDRIRSLVVTNTSIRRADWRGAGPNPLRLVKIPVVGEIAFRFAQRWMLKLAFRPFIADPAHLTEGLLDAFWEPFEHGFDRTLLRLFRAEYVDGTVENRWRDALRAHAGPALVVWGSRDPAFRVDRGHEIADLIPRAELIGLERSNHFVPLDQPRALARLIRRYALAH